MPTRVTDLLSLLHGHPLIRSIRIVHYDETPAGKIELKVRCRLPGNYQLQIWLHVETASQDYAYSALQRSAAPSMGQRTPLSGIATAPHHFHHVARQCPESTLAG